MRKTFLVPALASAAMGVVVWLVYHLFLYVVRANIIATIFAIMAGAIIYVVLLLLLKGLSEHEILRFPKGQAFVSLAKKMHLLH